MAIFEYIQSIDEVLLSLINQDLSNGFFDNTLVFFRNKYFWVPLYVFIVVSTLLHFKKHAYIILLTAVLCFSITDSLSSKLLKPLTERERPCNNAELEKVIVKAPCRNSFSFVSSHAANHTAIATFFFFLFYRKNNRWPSLLFLWAFLISIAQVYVGLHYPSDILAGAVLGFVVSTLGFNCLRRFYLGVYNVKMEI